jgi:hypothetical protein
MNPRSITRRALAPAFLATLGLLAACTTVIREPAPVHARVVVREMPAPVAEVVPPPPGHGWNWVPGHWVWLEGAWRWTAGHYVQVAVPPMPVVIEESITVAPSPAHIWVRGHWRWGGSAWVWAGGRWVIG